MKELPLLIDDYLGKAILEPKEMASIIISKYGISHDDIPKKCILSFKYTGLERIVKTRYKPIKKIPDIGGGAPLYILKVGNRRYCYSNLCIGGPCSAFLLEILYGLGIDEVVYIGPVGSLKEEIKPYDIVISMKAIRDEGTSYHYLPPSTYVEADYELYMKLRDKLLDSDYKVYEGILWTTDAAFRETKRRREIFVKLGALAVDMEAASLYAIAKYRGKKIIGIYYPIDLLKEDEWVSYIDLYGGLKYLNFINGLFKIALNILR